MGSSQLLAFNRSGPASSILEWKTISSITAVAQVSIQHVAASFSFSAPFLGLSSTMLFCCYPSIVERSRYVYSVLEPLLFMRFIL